MEPYLWYLKVGAVCCWMLAFDLHAHGNQGIPSDMPLPSMPLIQTWNDGKSGDIKRVVTAAIDLKKKAWWKSGLNWSKTLILWWMQLDLNHSLIQTVENEKSKHFLWAFVLTLWGLSVFWPWNSPQSGHYGPNSWNLILFWKKEVKDVKDVRSKCKFRVCGVISPDSNSNCVLCDCLLLHLPSLWFSELLPVFNNLLNTLSTPSSVFFSVQLLLCRTSAAWICLAWFVGIKPTVWGPPSWCGCPAGGPGSMEIHGNTNPSGMINVAQWWSNYPSSWLMHS